MIPLRWSSLKWMAKSPAHYRYYLDHPVAETDAMRIGSYAHHLLFGSPREFAVYQGVRRGKEWDAFKGSRLSVTILNERESDAAKRVADNLQRSTEAAAVLSGNVERRISWSLNGRECAGTPDAVSADGGIIADLKVTTDANPDKFYWHAARQGWLGQLAWYSDGLRACELGSPVEHYIVAVESKPPYVVQPFLLTYQAVEMGQRTYRLLFERLLVHEAADHWPGYVEGFAALDSPEDVTLQIDGEDVTA